QGDIPALPRPTRGILGKYDDEAVAHDVAVGVGHVARGFAHVVRHLDDDVIDRRVRRPSDARVAAVAVIHYHPVQPPRGWPTWRRGSHGRGAQLHMAGGHRDLE